MEEDSLSARVLHETFQFGLTGQPEGKQVTLHASLSKIRTTTNKGRGVSVLQMVSSLMFHQ